MRERALLFGDTKSLLGIRTEPPPESRNPGRPTVILLNAGLTHRVGPNRIYVKLARRLASVGLPAMRFDMSGIGDSRARRDAVSADERSVVETQAAMTMLASKRGANRFVLGGLCSGADNAFRAALTDARVAGLILIDPCLYSSLAYRLQAYAKRVWRPRSWVNLVTGQSELWGALRDLTARDTREAVRQRRENWKRIPFEELRTGLVTLSRRGVKVLLVYSSGSAADYNYRVHVRRKLGRSRVSAMLQVCRVSGADHIFTRLRHQDALLQVVERWSRQLEAQPKAARESRVGLSDPRPRLP